MLSSSLLVCQLRLTFRVSPLQPEMSENDLSVALRKNPSATDFVRFSVTHCDAVQKVLARRRHTPPRDCNEEEAGEERRASCQRRATANV